ncbi:9571_t:CDS:2 [Funneliformis geosporum]|nr:9571_t:CDS:2 [Funneliformis geosporum]
MNMKSNSIQQLFYQSFVSLKVTKEYILVIRPLKGNLKSNFFNTTKTLQYTSKISKMTSSVAIGRALERTLIEDLIYEGYEPEWTGGQSFGCKRSDIPALAYSPEGFIVSRKHESRIESSNIRDCPNDEGIDIKVEVDGTNFVIQSKNWKKMIFPGIVREMDEMLKRQPKGTVGDSKTSPFEILSITRANFIRPGEVKNCAAIRANHPIPEQCGLFYFEIDIIDVGKNGQIGIGFSTQSASLNMMPGWGDSSWGYHGDDGNKFYKDNGKQYGPKFMTGDTIGCCLSFRNNTVLHSEIWKKELCILVLE